MANLSKIGLAQRAARRVQIFPINNDGNLSYRTVEIKLSQIAGGDHANT
jgi:hypothetical protein